MLALNDKITIRPYLKVLESRFLLALKTSEDEYYTTYLMLLKVCQMQ